MPCLEANILAPNLKSTILWLLCFLQSLVGAKVFDSSVPIKTLIVSRPSEEIFCNGQHLSLIRNGCKEVPWDREFLSCGGQQFSLTDTRVLSQHYTVLRDLIDSHFVWDKSDRSLKLGLEYKSPYCVSGMAIVYYVGPVVESCLEPHPPSIKEVQINNVPLLEGTFQVTRLPEEGRSFHSTMYVAMATPVCDGKIQLTFSRSPGNKQMFLNEVEAFGTSYSPVPIVEYTLPVPANHRQLRRVTAESRLCRTQSSDTKLSNTVYRCSVNESAKRQPVLVDSRRPDLPDGRQVYKFPVESRPLLVLRLAGHCVSFLRLTFVTPLSTVRPEVNIRSSSNDPFDSAVKRTATEQISQQRNQTVATLVLRETIGDPYLRLRLKNCQNCSSGSYFLSEVEAFVYDQDSSECIVPTTAMTTTATTTAAKTTAAMAATTVFIATSSTQLSRSTPFSSPQGSSAEDLTHSSSIQTIQATPALVASLTSASSVIVMTTVLPTQNGGPVSNPNEPDSILLSSAQFTLAIAIPCALLVVILLILVLVVAVGCYGYKRHQQWSPPVSNEPLAKSRVSSIKRRPSDVYFVDEDPISSKPMFRRKMSFSPIIGGSLDRAMDNKQPMVWRKGSLFYTGIGSTGFIDAIVEPYYSGQSPQGGSLLEIPAKPQAKLKLSNSQLCTASLEGNCKLEQQPNVPSLFSLNSVPADPPPDYSELEQVRTPVSTLCRSNSHSQTGLGTTTAAASPPHPGCCEINVVAPFESEPVSNEQLSPLPGSVPSCSAPQQQQFAAIDPGYAKLDDFRSISRNLPRAGLECVAEMQSEARSDPVYDEIEKFQTRVTGVATLSVPGGVKPPPDPGYAEVGILQVSTDDSLPSDLPPPNECPPEPDLDATEPIYAEIVKPKRKRSSYAPPVPPHPREIVLIDSTGNGRLLNDTFWGFSDKDTNSEFCRPDSSHSAENIAGTGISGPNRNGNTELGSMDEFPAPSLTLNGDSLSETNHPAAVLNGTTSSPATLGTGCNGRASKRVETPRERGCAEIDLDSVVDRAVQTGVPGCTRREVVATPVSPELEEEHHRTEGTQKSSSLVNEGGNASSERTSSDSNLVSGHHGTSSNPISTSTVPISKPQSPAPPLPSLPTSTSSVPTPTSNGTTTD